VNIKWNSTNELPDEDVPVLCKIKYDEDWIGIDYGIGYRYKGKDKITCDRTGGYEIIGWALDA